MESPRIAFLKGSEPFKNEVAVINVEETVGTNSARSIRDSACIRDSIFSITKLTHQVWT